LRIYLPDSVAEECGSDHGGDKEDDGEREQETEGRVAHASAVGGAHQTVTWVEHVDAAVQLAEQLVRDGWSVEVGLVEGVEDVHGGDDVHFVFGDVRDGLGAVSLDDDRVHGTLATAAAGWGQTVALSLRLLAQLEHALVVEDGGVRELVAPGFNAGLKEREN
jgi:hypothetical protein